MLLGKRPRPSAMRRTTSLSEFAPNLLVPDPNPRERKRAAIKTEDPAVAASSPERRLPSVETTTEVEAAEFLRACGICKRHLGPGRDTFIYRSWSLDHSLVVPDQSSAAGAWISRCLSGPSSFPPFLDRLARFSSCHSGEAAFCSLECRQKQMKCDAVKEKIWRMLRKSKAPPPKPGPKASGGSGTVAAA